MVRYAEAARFAAIAPSDATDGAACDALLAWLYEVGSRGDASHKERLL